MKKASYRGTVKRLLGDDALKDSSITSIDGETVNFLVTNQKQANYLRHCNQVKLVEDPVSVINQYTEHTTELYGKVNLALAADSHLLQTHGDYIASLRSSILTQPLFDDGVLYRGVDLSQQEIDKMEEMNDFFIPSFTSTSIDAKKAYEKSAIMVIKVPFACKYAASITEKLSKYHSQEKEVLLACYSAFHLERIEKVGRTKVVSLFLDEHLTSFNSLVPFF